MSKIVMGLCALALFVFTPSVQADPIVITSGSVTIVGISGTPTYSIAGQNFSATSFGGDPGNTPNCGPCLSGVPTRTSSFLVGSSLGQGNAIVNGMTFTSISSARIRAALPFTSLTASPTSFRLRRSRNHFQ